MQCANATLPGLAARASPSAERSHPVLRLAQPCRRRAVADAGSPSLIADRNRSIDIATWDARAWLAGLVGCERSDLAVRSVDRYGATDQMVGGSNPVGRASTDVLFDASAPLSRAARIAFSDGVHAHTGHRRTARLTCEGQARSRVAIVPRPRLVKPAVDAARAKTRSTMSAASRPTPPSSDDAIARWNGRPTK